MIKIFGEDPLHEGNGAATRGIAPGGMPDGDSSSLDSPTRPSWSQECNARRSLLSHATRVFPEH